MAPLRQTRRSRRQSHKSPIEVVDHDFQRTASLQFLHVETTPSPSVVRLSPPSPSACTTTTTSSDSPSSIVTHLPFTPGSSHTRNRKEGHIPRPPNAFMVFRSWLWNKDNLKSIERDNRNVSRIAGRYWNELSEAERAPFRCMAEEAKARHAQLYPEYRYSPGSQKKSKLSQRRFQRTTDGENEKCKKVADLLLGGITSNDLAKYLGEGNGRVGPEGESTSGLVAECVAPRNVLPPQPIPVPLIPTPPSQYAIPLPVLPITEGWTDTTQTSGQSTRTPELTYPLDDMQRFIITDDIPHFSLDTCNGLAVNKDGDLDLTALFPPHLMPGAYSVFSGIKPDATSFVDSCVFGAHTTDVLAVPTPDTFSDFDIEPYPSLVPMSSPVFSNPFEPSTSTANNSAMLSTLEQLFGQPISPLANFFNENL